tara:strand:- start:199 stop:504 length:306 start_codon:yes stop_codon:yes gene_type:complete
MRTHVSNDRLDEIWGHLTNERQDTLRGLVYHFEDEAPVSEDCSMHVVFQTCAHRITEAQVAEAFSALEGNDRAHGYYPFDTQVVFDETTHTTHVRVEYAQY